MKYLVINGHSEFRAHLRHNADSVKQTTSEYYFDITWLI